MIFSAVSSSIILTNTQRAVNLKTQLISNNPKRLIERFQRRLNALEHRLTAPIQDTIQQLNIRFAHAHTGLDTLSPLATLSRGYSISKREADGSIVSSIKQLALGDKLRVQFKDGSVQTHVESINEKN